jgi:hypothetical protein
MEIQGVATKVQFKKKNDAVHPSGASTKTSTTRADVLVSIARSFYPSSASQMHTSTHSLFLLLLCSLSYLGRPLTECPHLTCAIQNNNLCSLEFWSD